METTTIGFIGLGLIGGSIAKAIRKFHPDYQILRNGIPGSHSVIIFFCALR